MASFLLLVWEGCQPPIPLQRCGLIYFLCAFHLKYSPFHASTTFFFHLQANSCFACLRLRMAAPPVDTSMMGYASGSVDGQDDIYRNRQRLQPYPLLPNDSGYASTMKVPSIRHQVPSYPSLLTLANSVKCNELLSNESNFAAHTTVECYESNDCSISTFWDCSSIPVTSS